jgi:hypothetical protein
MEITATTAINVPFTIADLDRLVVLWRTLEVLGNFDKQNALSDRIEASGLTEEFIARSLGF